MTLRVFVCCLGSAVPRVLDGGKRKNSILTNTRGRIWRVEVHTANVHDGVVGPDLIYPDFAAQLFRAIKLLADSAYIGQFVELKGRLGTVVFECPVRDPQPKGFVIEAKRWMVE
ncbi:hypothetical protein [Neolewinella antarctica]|uniref:Uncharacterized protein n=1 Tax=Neolewinella antarctica TaxID=442734 RepID=A0ABX0XEK4_9BACT|nr:hypothetical protein [Neolewinella antarctica]NJC27182.1 hypothetical protein [Neolewinella antarctica]